MNIGCFLAGLILVLLLSYVCYRYQKQSKQLYEVKKALSESIKNGNYESVLLFTDMDIIRQLVVEINTLLEQQRDLEVRQVRQEESERRMLVNISHDLKTPLTVIYGYAEMLLTSEENMPLKSRAKIEKIYAKTKDVLEMIHLFFDLAKMESGELQLNTQKIDICEVCRSELAGYYEMLQEIDCEIQIQIPEKELFIYGDEQALKRILGNLIQNAVRYGADGRFLGIQVSERREWIQIDVTDKGKGIVEENQDKIFERLTTLEDSRNKKYQGSGLGLTITKRLTEAMGGSIQVKSVPYSKTTFTICFQKQV